MSLLSGAMRVVLEPLTRCCEMGFEFLLRRGEAGRCLPAGVSYCRNIPEAKDLSADRHGAGRYHPCVSCDIKYDDMERGERGTRRMGAETIATRQKIEVLKESVAGLTGKGHKSRRSKIGEEIKRLLFEQSLAECRRFWRTCA